MLAERAWQTRSEHTSVNILRSARLHQLWADWAGAWGREIPQNPDISVPRRHTRHSCLPLPGKPAAGCSLSSGLAGSRGGLQLARVPSQPHSIDLQLRWLEVEFSCRRCDEGPSGCGTQGCKGLPAHQGIGFTPPFSVCQQFVSQTGLEGKGGGVLQGYQRPPHWEMQALPAHQRRCFQTVRFVIVADAFPIPVSPAPCRATRACLAASAPDECLRQALLCTAMLCSCEEVAGSALVPRVARVSGNLDLKP